VENWSMGLDLRILVATALVVLVPGYSGERLLPAAALVAARG
jgi:hypothetical protein